jgi:hypothetical protein
MHASMDACTIAIIVARCMLLPRRSQLQTTRLGIPADGALVEASTTG